MMNIGFPETNLVNNFYSAISSIYRFSSDDFEITPDMHAIIRAKKIDSTPLLTNGTHNNSYANIPIICSRNDSPYSLNYLNRNGNKVDALVDELSSVETDERFRVKTLHGQMNLPVSLQTIVRNWKTPNKKIHITDLNVKSVNGDTSINLDYLSPCNLLRLGSSGVAQLEMFTFILSTSNSLTYSHSDDVDSLNYSLKGKKVWLAWETQEGLENGLEDIEFLNLHCPPHFSLDKFLALKSSVWFVAEPGYMISLPGRYTHAVVALEDYIGISNFCFSLPTALETLIRWSRFEPLFAKRTSQENGRKIIREIIDISIKRVREIEAESNRGSDPWGYQGFRESALRLNSIEMDYIRTSKYDQKLRELYELAIA